MICARSEVGLSRLPVTEEIAGSNPVERATDNSPLDRVFFYGKNMPYLLHLCAIYVMILPIGLKSLRSFTIKYLTMSEKGPQALWLKIMKTLTQAVH